MAHENILFVIEGNRRTSEVMHFIMWSINAKIHHVCGLNVHIDLMLALAFVGRVRCHCSRKLLKRAFEEPMGLEG